MCARGLKAAVGVVHTTAAVVAKARTGGLRKVGRQDVVGGGCGCGVVGVLVYSRSVTVIGVRL